MTEYAFFMQDVMVELNKKIVLDIAELGIAAGRIHAVIGPSGAGKTTLLRVLNLIQTPARGEIKYFGKLLRSGSADRLATQRTMSMVFQKPALFSGDVFFNVALGLKLRGVSAGNIRNMVTRALKMVGLSDLAGRPASRLSGGEAQRIALARALVIEPKVLLLDEPTANLDPANVAMFEEIIKKVHAETNTTIIIVTHNLYQAKRVSHESIFVNRGKAVEANPTAQLFTDPAAEETKLFISGDMVY